MRIAKLFPVLAGMLAVAFIAPAVAQPGPGGGAQAAHGYDVFMSHGCWECHGTVGQGGQGPALLPKLPAFEVFETFVRQGSPVGMLPFSPKMLSDADMSAAYAYLKSQPPPPHPDLLFPK